MRRATTLLPVLFSLTLGLAGCAVEDETCAGDSCASGDAEPLTLGPIYTRPAITGISPVSGAPGTTVTITGHGFDTLMRGPAAFGNTTLSGARATLQYVSSSQMTAVVPAGAAPGRIYLLGLLTTLSGSPSVQLTSAQSFTPLVAPAAPTGLTARVVSDTQVDLTWTDASWNETGFDIWIQDVNGWRSLGTVAANHTSEPITMLWPGNTYGFKLRAVNATGNSGFSNSVTATTTRTFVDVTILSSTSSSPLRPRNGASTFSALSADGFSDAAPADGVVAGFAAGGVYPRWGQATNGSPPALLVREGNLFATANGARANLIIDAEIPGTGGSNGGSQFVTVHLLVTTNAQGVINGVTHIATIGGDNSLNVNGRLMIAYQWSYSVGGSLNGRVHGTVTATLFMNEPYATAGGLGFDHHETELEIDFDVPVTAR